MTDQRSRTDPKQGQPPDTEYAAVDQSIAFSPKALAGGFAILAALIVLVVGRRRRRKREG